MSAPTYSRKGARCVVCGGTPEVWIWNDDLMSQEPFCGLCEPEDDA